MRTYRLYIDELGSANPKAANQPYFIVCACVVSDATKDKIKIHADQVKFKYWAGSYEDVVFHSQEIGRKDGPFTIFKGNARRYGEFMNDLCAFLRTSPFRVFVGVVDKRTAQQLNWDANKILKESAAHIIGSFVRFLVGSQAKGRVVIESATDAQNYFFLKSFNYYLSPKAIEGIDFRTVQESLTALSFVTKKNHDIEEQIADLLAYAARCKYERDVCGKQFKPTDYEAKIIKILEAKLFSTPPKASRSKKKILNQINAYKILTKKRG